MPEKIWLNLLHFSSRRGLESLWIEKPQQYIRNDHHQRVLETTFPNFVVSSLTQGGKGVEGLHGPFPVKDIPELSALVQLFYLAGDDARNAVKDKSDHLHVLVIYQDATLEGLLSPDIIARIESIILQWARSEVKTKNQLNKKRFRSLKHQLESLYQEIEESGTLALQEEIARNSLATVLLQANEFLSRKNKHLILHIYYTDKLLIDLVPLIYTSLVKENKHHLTKILHDPTADDGFLDLGHVIINVKGYQDETQVIKALQSIKLSGDAVAHLIFHSNPKKAKSFVNLYLEAQLPSDFHENVYMFLNFKKDGDVVKCRNQFASKLGPTCPSLIGLTISEGKSMSLELFQALADNLIEIAVLTTS